MRITHPIGARWPSRAAIGLLAGAILGLGIYSWFRPWTTDQLAATPLSSVFLILLGVVGIAVAWFRYGYREHGQPQVAGWLPWFFISMAGVLLANTVWVFMTAWEIMALTSFFLVIADRQPPNILKQGYIYWVMSQMSAMAILAGFFLLAATLHSVHLSEWAQAARYLPLSTKMTVFWLLLLGFGTKSGLVPFHVWLPRAHPVAPASVSALMSGVMIKLGIFGVMQFVIGDLGPMPEWTGLAIIALGALSAVTGVLYAVMETDLKRLLAYSSIENIGIIVVGLGLGALGEDTGHPALWIGGLLASLFHTVNHGLFKSQLFMAAGAVEQHTGTLDADRLGGLIHTIPGVFWAFFAGAMALSGLPPLSGFASEWLTFQTLLTNLRFFQAAGGLVMLAAGLGLAASAGLALMTMVKAVGVIFLGEPRRPVGHRPLPAGLVSPLLVLSTLSLAIGVFPAVAIRELARVVTANWFPLPTLGVLDHLPVILLALGGLVAGLQAMSRRTDTRAVPRWATGREASSAMQWTSVSMTKSVRTTFALLYRPHRQLIREGTEARYYPERLQYQGGTEAVWDRYFYRPLYRVAWRLSHWVTRVQAGPIRWYVAYVLVTTGVFLLWVRGR